jgi:hypothetical protein
VHIRPSRPLTGTAVQDSDALLGGLRAGHAHFAIDGIATPPPFVSPLRTTTARPTRRHARAARTARADIRMNAPPAFITRRKTARPWPDHHEQHIQVQAGEAPGIFTVEVRTPTTIGRRG